MNSRACIPCRFMSIWMASLAAPMAAAGGLDEPVEGQAVVRIEDEFTIQEVAATYNATVEAEVDGGSRPFYLLGLPPGLPSAQFLLLAESDDRIRDADYNWTAGDPDPGTQSFFLSILPGHFHNQPLRYTTDLNRDPLFGGDTPAPAAPIIVAIVDTGVDPDHPALQGAVLPGVSFVFGDPATNDPGNGQDDDGDGAVDELRGHGTFIAALTRLIAPNAQILPIRVVKDDGGTNVFSVAEGIRAAIDGGAKVINVSLGSTADANVIEDLAEEARLAGAVLVASAGNDGDNTPRFPAAFPGVIAVAGVDNSDVKAPFSNFGSHIAISAPAVDIASATPDLTWSRASGTSFSAAVVTGAVARALGYAPTTSPAQIRLLLEQTAEPIDLRNPAYAGLLGAGRINIGALLDAVGGVRPLVRGDASGDSLVNSTDLNIVLSGFGQATPIGDVSGDGAIDSTDLNIVLTGFGGH